MNSQLIYLLLIPALVGGPNAPGSVTARPDKKQPSTVVTKTGDLRLHPVPGEFADPKRFIVRINGQPVPVFHAGLKVYFVSFDFTGDVAVTVESKEADFWRGKAEVRPLSCNVQSETNGSTTSFSLSKPGQYSVERPGTGLFGDEVILVFANPPEKDIPPPTGKNVLYLKPGIHQQHISLKSDQTLYLAAGAVLFGSINVWNARNVRILGRGTVVYYGPQSEDRDDGWQHRINWHPLTTHNVHGLTVSGITFVGRSRTWTIQTHTTFDAVFDNIKILAVNPQNVNGDGIDWYGGGRTKIINSLIRSMDDCFAFFTPTSSEDMWSRTKATDGEVSDITIENCVLWTTLANVFRVGFNGQNLITNRISMRDCDVIHIRQNKWFAPWSVLCVVSPNNKGKARHRGYLFENIRFEEPTALLGLQNEEAQLTDIQFKSITMRGKPVPSMVQCPVEGLLFEKVVLNGIPVAGEVDMPFEVIKIPLRGATYRP